MFQGSGQVGVDSIRPGCPGAGPRRSVEGQGRAVLGLSRLIGYPKNKSKCAAEVDTTAVSQSFVLIWVSLISSLLYVCHYEKTNMTINPV